MYSIVSTAILHGIQSIPVNVEADVSDGMPMFEMVGFLASEVRESKERVRTALRNSGILLPAKRITINLTPADIRKTGSGFDLPIAVAVLAALGIIPKKELEDTFFTGEIGLNGKLNPVHGVLPMTEDAKKRGLNRCIVPYENCREAQLVPKIQVTGVTDIQELIEILQGKKYESQNCAHNIEETAKKIKQPDFSEVNGQVLVKRACEAAVSGMHNLLMIGSPGAGKSMIAMRIPSILPPLEESEQMELSKIYSVSGLFSERQGLMTERPFRSPHHTITAQGLTGGGAFPKPGEISLAHKGVLFLDELPEFQKNTLETLRQPLEEKKVRLIRLQGSCEYPADFMLVAAMNPCRCGYYPDMQKCRCTRSAIERYVGRISRPLLDRIDICVEAPRLSFAELSRKSEEETSERIRKRVCCVQQIQKERYKKEEFQFNSQIPASRLKEFCELTKEQEYYMEGIYQKLDLTARSYHKILKVARTLADMEEEKNIQDRHLNEAICYRSIDKKFWEN